MPKPCLSSIWGGVVIIGYPQKPLVLLAIDLINTDSRVVLIWGMIGLCWWPVITKIWEHLIIAINSGSTES